VFFNSEAFSQLKEMRDNKVCNWVLHFQALLRGYLIRSRLTGLKVSKTWCICHLNVSCVLVF